jgi:hypothetical protein
VEGLVLVVSSFRVNVEACLGLEMEVDLYLS